MSVILEMASVGDWQEAYSHEKTLECVGILTGLKRILPEGYTSVLPPDRAVVLLKSQF